MTKKKARRRRRTTPRRVENPAWGQPTACRLPHDARRILDFIALGAGTTPSMVMRALIEDGLIRLGYPLDQGVTAISWPERDTVKEWIAQNLPPPSQP